MFEDDLDETTKKHLREEDAADRLRDRKTIQYLVLVGIAVFLIWLATPFIAKQLYNGLDDRARFGDVFGIINALFSGLAFSGVVIAIFQQQKQINLQRRELFHQRLELKFTRHELARSAEAQNASQLALNKAVYAQTFKVALDIFDGAQSLEARNHVRKLKDKRDVPSEWLTDDIRHADVMVRVFEQIATLVRLYIVPSNYIVETWAIHICRNWRILEAYVQRVRKERNNPFTAREFEKLYVTSNTYLESEGIKFEL